VEYQTFNDLPNHIKVNIQRLEVQDPKVWVLKQLPGLGDRSVLEILNNEGEDGERIILQFILSISAY
jgi:hypothetical protein